MSESTCTILREGEECCGRPALVDAVGGCVHEHLIQRFVCIECWAETLVFVSRGTLFCHPCTLAGHPGESVVFTQIAYLDQEVSLG